MALNFILYLKRHKVNKLFLYRVGFVVILALMPFLAKADSGTMPASANTGPVDPIKAGQFARTINEHLPQEFYIDPDFVVLNEMGKNNYTLAQQLAVNDGKNIGPDRPAPTYEFKAGDTISSVAQKFNLHVGSILDASHIAARDAKHIKVGTVLSIPSSDTNTSEDWLKATQAPRVQTQAQRVVVARETSTGRSQIAPPQTASASVGGITVIGVSYEQCLPWARENSGIEIHGYAGNVQPNAYEPKVGAIALDAFVGHASIVVGVGDDYIVVHEANWVRGKLTERTVSKSAIRGYVY